MSGTLALTAVLLLIVANGIFVAAEFALVTVRRPVVEDYAAQGDRRAKVVVRELSDVSFALSVAQFGITVTSLLVGYLAEQAVGDTLLRPLLAAVGLPEQASLAVAVGGAFLLSTGVQVIIGELVPKNVAIAHPLGTALWLTPFTRAFGQLLRPVIAVFDRSSAAVARRLFRIEIADELERGRSLDELSRIIHASGEDGSLSEEQTELLGRAVGLGDIRVSAVMVPRNDVERLSAGDTLEDLRRAAARTGFSRFPVCGESEDDVVGTVHVKDLLAVPADERATTPLEPAPVLAVPESVSLRQLLADLRRAQRTFALVVDEHGSTAGIVTVEDVLERLVGDIADEFDTDTPSVRRAGVGRHLIDGSLRLDEFEATFAHSLPEGPYETVAGFLLERLGRIPEPGETVEHGDCELIVMSVDGQRVTEIEVRLPAGGRS